MRIIILTVVGGLICLLSCSKQEEISGPPLQTPPEVIIDGNGIVRPAPGAKLHWQLSGTIDLSQNVSTYDLDAFETSKEMLTSLKASGKYLIAYISFGTLEDYRSDGNLLPAEVIGQKYPEWPDERFIDIRAIEKIKPWVTARLDMIKAKGFDAVEPDNMDGYQNSTGFNLTEEDEKRFCLWLAEECHKRGLAIGQKNAPELSGSLVSTFDWALLEDAFADDFMNDFSNYSNAGKAVFAVEYSDRQIDMSGFCAKATALHYDGQRKNRELDAATERGP